VYSQCMCMRRVCSHKTFKSIPTINDSYRVPLLYFSPRPKSCAIAPPSGHPLLSGPPRERERAPTLNDIHQIFTTSSKGKAESGALPASLFTVPHKGLQVCTGELPVLVPGYVMSCCRGGGHVVVLYLSRPAALKTGLEAILTRFVLDAVVVGNNTSAGTDPSAEDEVAGAIVEAGLEAISRCFALDAVDEKPKHGGASRGCGRGRGWGGGSPAAPACACTLRSHP